MWRRAFMEMQELATYYYVNYDRWLRHVRLARKRCWPPYPVLNIPNDADSEVAVQNGAGKVMLYADRFTEANREHYIKRVLDWEVGEYWRDKRGPRGTGPLDPNLPAPGPPAGALDAKALESRLTRAFEQAKGDITPPERVAFGAWWKARGDAQRARRIFRVAQTKYTDYDGALHG